MRPSLLALLNVGKAWLLLGGFVALLFALGWALGGVRLGSLFFVVMDHLRAGSSRRAGFCPPWRQLP